MTEQEWQSCNDPKPMLEFVRSTASKRKLRLFGVACCRRIGHLLRDKRSWAVIDHVEQFADGLVSTLEVIRVSKEAENVPIIHGNPADQRHAATAAYLVGGNPQAVDRVVTWASDAVAWKTIPSQLPRYRATMDETIRLMELGEQAILLREIFGNPFRSLAIDSAFRTPNVTAVGQAIYEARRFSDMPILADALEESGCTNQDILDHCRNGHEHVRGCWVVDLVLGKE